MEWILLGDLFIFVGGFMFGSLWQKSRPTQRAVDGANVCPDCETTSNMYRCESCGCQWSPRN